MKNYIEKQIKEVKDIMIMRAREYAEAFIVDDLFDIDCDKFPVSLYDMEDMNNHNYDLGRLKTLEELKNL